MKRTEYSSGNANAAAERLHEMSVLYENDFVEPPLKGLDFYSAARFRDRFSEQYAGAPNFRVVLADGTDGLTGYGFGCSLPEGSPWWSGMDEPLPEEFTRETGNRTFALLELLVARDSRTHGIAGELHRRLLEGRTEERVSLLCSPPQMPAYAIWQHWGYEKVGQLRPAEDANLLHAFVRPLVR